MLDGIKFCVRHRNENNTIWKTIRLNSGNSSAGRTGNAMRFNASVLCVLVKDQHHLMDRAKSTK